MSRRSVSTMVELSPAATFDLYEACEAGYPLEVCGMLLGVGDGEQEPWQVSRIAVTNNAHDGDRRGRYRIPAESQLAVESQARRQGEEILGYFHSHPDCLALPSDQDRAQAWRGYLYVICSVLRAKVADVAAFALVDDSDDFCRVLVAPRLPVASTRREIRTCP